MNDPTQITTNGNFQVAALREECERLRARVAQLERENGAMQEELERRLRREIQEGFGVTYEELLAHPEKHSRSITAVLDDLETKSRGR